jgi:glycine hydroxymethyltransferase
MQAAGSLLTNKYSEGYPGARYYEGQSNIDQIETLAIKRACELFGAEHANVQPYSGSPANLAAMFALLEPGDTIMGLNLSEGGHLTHGFKLNFSAKFFKSVAYTLDPKTETLDYDQIAELAKKHKPKMIIAGYTAYPREVDFAKFREIADSVGAYLLADISHINALVIAGLHSDPVPYADVVTTTTHKALRGPRGGLILCKKQHATKIDKAIMPGLQGGPHNHITAAKAVAFKLAQQDEFKTYAKAIVDNAKALEKSLLEHNVRLVSGGTDTHLLIIDAMHSFNVNGRELAQALNKVGIVCNCNTIPFDPNPPFKPSGIRIGTPAITTRGLTPDDMPKIAHWIVQTAQNINNQSQLENIHTEVLEFLKTKPLDSNFA